MISPKISLLLLPILLWLPFGLYISHEKDVNGKHFYPVDGLEWPGENGPIRASLSKQRANEMDQYELRIHNSSGKELLYKEYAVDWDMNGGGMVAALQADGDEPLEIIMFEKNTRNRLFLDQQDGIFVERSYDELSPAKQRIIIDWLRLNANQMEMGLLIILTFGYYLIIYPLFLLIIWLWRKSHRTRASGQ